MIVTIEIDKDKMQHAIKAITNALGRMPMSDEELNSITYIIGMGNILINKSNRISTETISGDRMTIEINDICPTCIVKMRKYIETNTDNQAQNIKILLDRIICICADQIPNC